MKKLNELRQRKIVTLAIILIGMIAGLMLFTAPEKATGTTIAMALTIGGVTLTDKEEAVYTALQDTIKTEMSKFDKGYITETKMNEAIAAAIAKTKINLADDAEFKKLNDVLEKQGLEIVALKEKNGGSEKIESVEKQIKDQIGEHKDLRSALDAAKGGKLNLVIKVPNNPMTVANTVTPGSAYLPMPVVEAGYDRKPTINRIIRALANVATIASKLVVWHEKYGEEGDAAWLGENGLKPNISFKVRMRQQAAKKIAVMATVSTESLEDIPNFMADIKAEIFDVIDEKEETDFLTGPGLADEDIKGIIPQVGGYTLVGVFTENANNMDAIRAAYTQISALGFKPNVVVISPIDKANMDLSKGSDGHYLLPPFSTANGQIISNVRVEESSRIATGKFLIGDFTKVNIRDYKEFAIQLGYDSDDFSHNRVSVIGEKRLMLYIKNHQLPGFIYDDFAVVKAAIETPVVPEPPVG
jgi:hypothetical protein